MPRSVARSRTDAGSGALKYQNMDEKMVVCCHLLQNISIYDYFGFLFLMRIAVRSRKLELWYHIFGG